MITDILRWFALFAASFVLQTAFIQTFAIGGVHPDLVLIALFLFAMRFGCLPATIVGFFTGLGQDLYATQLLGQNALGASVTGFFIGLFNVRVMRTDPVFKMVILVLAFMVHDITVSEVVLIKNHISQVTLFSEILFKTLPLTLYSMVIVALVYIWEYFFKPSSIQ
ncbi:MAG: rod shape-determining protein MreD [Chitinivibrionales bacterium]|nr:rod shape-determining protein MreD [Chitinivibrionales bacterium]